MAVPVARIDLARARSHWHARAGLAARLRGEPDEVIAQTGWLRTLGGADVYLAARARVPGLSRAELDGLVDVGRLRVVPAVRGCIYLVPAVHVPLALRVADEAWRKRTSRDLERTGSSWNEVEQLGRAVAGALVRGAATTDAIRKALPASAVRSLGDTGKELGLSSPLPVALRDLEFRGVIERTLDHGRLDTEPYLWRTTRSGVLGKVADDPVERWAALARIFAGHAGPTTLADFAWWAGLNQRDARSGFERAALAPIAVAGYSDDAWALPEDAELLASPAVPSRAVALLSFEDNYFVPRGSRWLIDPSLWSRPVQVWGSSKPSTLGAATHLSTRTVMVGEQIAGIWEMDPDAGQVLWATFAAVPRDAREAIDRIATETATFLNELGHARSVTLDTEEQVRERASEVARMAGGGDMLRDKRGVGARVKAKPPARKAAAAAKPPVAASRKKPVAASRKKPIAARKKPAARR